MLIGIGILVVGFWLVAILPALATPLGYPRGGEIRRFLFGGVWPLIGSALLLAGGLSGVRRCRAAGRSGATAGAVAFGAAAAAGAIALACSLPVAATLLP